MRGFSTQLTSPALAAALLALAAGPAFAEPAAADPNEKLPAQLPSVTIQGEDRSGQGDRGAVKLAPSSVDHTAPVRLPEPAPKRATSEGNRALMVNVTPSTLESPAALPQAVMPFTSVLGGYGPLTQFRVGLYDARQWGPAVGITELDGRAGWGWSGWHGKEWLDWTGKGSLSLEGDGFAWNLGQLQGGQNYFAAGAEAGESEDLVARVDYQRGQLGAGQSAAVPGGSGDFNATLARAFGQLRPAPLGDHQLAFQLTGQHRVWGSLAGPEAYALASDFWSLSDTVQLEAALGGGYWGFEPIVDPRVAFHYRPQPDTHMFASLRSGSELPDFSSLYMRRPVTVANPNLAAERVAAWAEVGGSHRLTDAVWGSVTGGLRRSYRHVYWADPQGTGLWTPVNAAAEQYAPSVDARAQVQWLPNLSQDLAYRWSATYPLNTTQHTLGTRLEGRFLDQKLGLGLGLEGRWVSLSTQQLAGGGTGSGVFSEADLSYDLTRDLTLSLTASDVPLALKQPGRPDSNYFVPIPLLTANVQYKF